MFNYKIITYNSATPNRIIYIIVIIDNIIIDILPDRYYREVSIILIAFQISLKNIINIKNKTPDNIQLPIARYKKSLSLVS